MPPIVSITFDHTLVASSDDPLLKTWRTLGAQGALDLRVMDNVGMECSTQLVWEKANACCACYESLPDWYDGRTP